MRGGAGRDPDENEWVAPLIEDVPTTTPATGGVRLAGESESMNIDHKTEHERTRSL